MIRPAGKGKYAVFSHKTGKRLSKPSSREGAEAALRRIRFFAHAKKGK